MKRPARARRGRAGFLGAAGVLAVCLAAAFLLAPPAAAFTIDPGSTNNTPEDASDDLLAAARWSHLPGALVDRGVRGLGGGLEYAMAGDFCAVLIPQFIDDPRPTCGQIREAVRRAFERWSSGQPLLRFTDVSERLRAQLPPPDEREPWRGFGAEIDLLAPVATTLPRVRGLGAVTAFWAVAVAPVGTAGRVLPGVTLTSADMVFNARSCYHHDPGLTGRGCNHFESLVLHEIGHTLDLHHPGENPRRNFDSDENPLNVIPVDCQIPTRGLRLSPALDHRAVMNRGVGEPMPVLFGLTNDDLGGRNFHYPVCPGGRPAPPVAPLGLLGLPAIAVAFRLSLPPRRRQSL